MKGRIMPRTDDRRDRKAKKSYTLSVESVAFLETLRKAQRAPSASSVLEGILKDARRDRRKKDVDRAVTEYYSALTPHEVEQQLQWGDFALREFPPDAE